MDYYIVINGQKQGPFDLLGFIKKVKNGVITAETLISTSPDGPFVPASQVDEVKEIVQTSDGPGPVSSSEGALATNRIFSDAVELWSRKIIEYTMMVGIIVVLGILFSITIKKIQFIADYSYIADYLTSVIIVTALGVFAYYVLLTKRNQEVDKKDISNLIQSVLPALIGYSMLISIAVVTFGINHLAAVITMLVMLVVLSLVIFVPFLVTDHRLKLGRAMVLSVNAAKSLGASGALVLASLVGVNIIAAALPALLGNDAAFIGLVITLPLTASALAYIYDQVLA